MLNKRRKMKILSCAVIICVLLSAFGLSFSVPAAVVYNASVAIDFAESNCEAHPGDPNYDPDSENWECAEFVARCLYAGGLTIAYNANGSVPTRCPILWDNLEPTFQEFELTATLDSYVNISGNENKVAVGDPIFWRCEKCGASPHVILCNGYNSNGVLLYYARNDSHNNTTFWYYARNCPTSSCELYGQPCKLYSIRIVPSVGQINIVFKKNNVNWPDPTGGNLAYVVNTATNTRYNLTKDSSATYKYSTANTLPYGTYKVYLPTGNGNTTAYHSTVTLDSSTETVMPYYYTLSFNANGGTGSAPAQIIRLKGQTATLPGKNTLAKTDGQFRGWSETTSGTSWFVEGYIWTVTGAKTFYASWRPLVTAYVTVKRNGTTWTECYNSMELRNSSGDTYFLYRQSDGRYRATNVPTGTYDIYVGSDGSSGLVKTDSVTLTQSSTTATVNYYTITFNANGGSGTVPATKTCAAGASMSVPYGSTLSRNNYTFCYWVNMTGLIIPGTTHLISQQDTFYAWWNPGNYALGDADRDGAITSTDARLIEQYAVGKITEADLDTTLADYDGDGEVTATDARLVLQAYAAAEMSNTSQNLLNSNGEPLTWDDLDWSLLDWDAIDWDNFSFADLVDMLTAGQFNPGHEIM